jgi:hypothetical protein
MPLPLFTDLKNDKGLPGNIVRVIVFLIVFFLIDLIVSLFLLKGIERFYGLKGDADILMLGHSHLMLAVDKELLEERSGLEVAKYTREGVNMADRRVMAEHYFSTCSSKPGTVILGIDPWLFSGEGLSLNSHTLFYPFMDNPATGEYIRRSVPSSFEYYRVKLIRSSRFHALLLNASLRGWLKNWDNLKFGVIDTARYINEETLRSFRKITFNRDLMDDFSSTLDFLKEQDTEVILLNTPVWKPVVRAQHTGYDRTMHIIDSLAHTHCPAAVIIDLVPEFSGRTELFFDPIHMNPEGQRVVTEFLGKWLKSR